jgi:hypothetical protein
VPQTEESVALVLTIWIVIAEKPEKLDRQWILDTYVDCLAAVRMERVLLKQPYWH